MKDQGRADPMKIELNIFMNWRVVHNGTKMR